MYKQILTDTELTWNNGIVKPVATLADEHGGICQIVEDDHCYVLLLRRDTGYKLTSWIFPEAFEVLKILPSLK